MTNNILDNMKCSYDPEKQVIQISITSNFLTRYSDKLPEFIYNAKGLPEGLKVSMKNTNTALISLPTSATSEIVDEDNNMMRVAVDGGDINTVVNAFGDFVNAALRQELDKLNFIPLKGYPVEELSKEMKDAITRKSDFCIIPDYKTFQEKITSSESDYTFPQYRVDYLTEEFCDVVSYITEGNMKGLNKALSSKLKDYSWN